MRDKAARHDRLPQNKAEAGRIDMSRVLRAFFVVLAAAGWMAAGPAALAPTKPAVTSLGPDFPKTAIFIGNSFFYYNNGLPGHLSLMEKAADPANKQVYRNTMVTIGGSGFDWHEVESYFRPNAIGSYSFDDHNNVVFNKPGKLFDAAVMMDCSQCPIHPKLKPVFTEYTKKDSDIVRGQRQQCVGDPGRSRLRACASQSAGAQSVRRRPASPQSGRDVSGILRGVR